MLKMIKPVAFLLASLCGGIPAMADPAIVEAVKARQTGDTWRFDVTLSHPDTGWDHYADGWRVLDMNDAELGLRVLAHPHVNEQPFTRALSDVAIPAATQRVQIQTRDTQDGWSDARYIVQLK